MKIQRGGMKKEKGKRKNGGNCIKRRKDLNNKCFWVMNSKKFRGVGGGYTLGKKLMGWGNDRNAQYIPLIQIYYNASSRRKSYFKTWKHRSTTANVSIQRS